MRSICLIVCTDYVPSVEPGSRTTGSTLPIRAHGLGSGWSHSGEAFCISNSRRCATLTIRLDAGG
jgi:hypothetical protein